MGVRSWFINLFIAPLNMWDKWDNQVLFRLMPQVVSSLRSPMILQASYLEHPYLGDWEAFNPKSETKLGV